MNAPRIERRAAMRLAGLSVTYRPGAMAGLAAQWRKFQFHIGAIPGEIAGAAFGVVLLGPEESEDFTYLTAVEIDGAAELPRLFSRFEIPASRYAVFPHHGDVSAIPETVRAAFRAPAAASRARPAGVELIERYGPGFNPAKGEGDVEILIPLAG